MDKIRVLIVGGQSRSGLALRALFEGRSEFLPTVLVRRQVAARAGERIVTVSDYFSVPDEILRQTDSVVNLAGVTTGKSRQDFWPPNVEGPLRLAEAAKAAGVRHFLQLSSLSVYGGAEAIGPGTLESPTSPYGQSKLAADRGLLALGD
ncbi:MAG: NAD-dependent epimerase/dehydratase family protein, partial [Alphaproteobacteria bacterium]|nr:NAD-dependent epimerase/dehydratase family protein [Alphaproteobacteria bacterium]